MMSEEMLDRIYAPRINQRIRTHEDFEFAVTALCILVTAFAKDVPGAKWITEPVF